jgi:hypothetical protein
MLIVHFQVALLRLSIEVLVAFGSLYSGVLPQKTPKQNSHVLRFASLHCSTVALLPFMLGVPPWTPLPIDFTA